VTWSARAERPARSGRGFGGDAHRHLCPIDSSGAVYTIVLDAAEPFVAGDAANPPYGRLHGLYWRH
jgi:hypothetical protein